MRANKWRGTEIARHGYSTRFGAGGSINKRRCDAYGTGRLRAWRVVCFVIRSPGIRDLRSGAARRRAVVSGVAKAGRNPSDSRLAFQLLDLSRIVLAKPLRTFARHALVAGASAALAHALAALRALVSLAWGRGGAAAGLVGGAAGKRDKRRDNSGKQISWGHGILPSSWEQPSAASPSNRTWHAWPWPALHCRGSAGQRQCCVPGVTISPNDGSGRARRQVGVRQATQAAREKRTNQKQI